VAVMRMMGAESVAYHQATVLGRGDDYPGQALAYYASRGETPLMWGGAAAARLGLSGAVNIGEYSAIFGPGGARHPGSDDRLVSARRPAMQLIISAHKSVAELGVSAGPRTCTRSWTPSATPPWPTSRTIKVLL
jgi:TrwC relaxase